MRVYRMWLVLHAQQHTAQARQHAQHASRCSQLHCLRGRLLTRLRPSPPSGVVVMLSMKMLWLRLLCLLSWCSPITRLDSPCGSHQGAAKAVGASFQQGRSCRSNMTLSSCATLQQ